MCLSLLSGGFFRVFKAVGINPFFQWRGLAMDRWRRPSVWLLLGLTLSGGLAPTSGCTMLATGLWMIKGINEKADFPGLNGKRVAVVCRPVSSLQYRNPTVGRD